MGSTLKPFILFEGPVVEDCAKFNALRMIKCKLNQLEKEVVSYSNDNFTIGSHTFRYDSLQTLGLKDLKIIFEKGSVATKYIYIKGKDGKEFVLIAEPHYSSSRTVHDVVRVMVEKAQDLMGYLNEGWEHLQQIEMKKKQAEAQKQLEISALEKIRKIVAVSTRLKLEMMQQVLSLDTATFNNKIFDWAAEFKFKIDGDYVVIEGGDVTGFISKLDAEFADWGKKDGKKG